MHISRTQITPLALTLMLAGAALGGPLASAQEPVDVRIAEILPDPASGREFVELWNAGDAVDLQGWSVSDAAGTTFTFPEHTLAPGARLVVWTGGENDALGYAWPRSAVWNNGGDTVVLHDADGQVVDSFAYGDDTPAPATDRSLQWDGSAWVEAAATPGTAFGAQSGSIEVEVANAAPTVSLSGTSGWARPGKATTVRATVDDPNGAADISGWELYLDGTNVAAGDGLPGDLSVEVPSATSAQLRMVVSDAHGAQGEATRTLVLRDSPLLLTAPGDGLSPLVLSAGAPAVLDAPFTIRNDDAAARTPLLDVSPLRGPVEMDLEGLLEVGWSQDGEEQWVLYEGPLQPLPPIPAESDGQLWFRFPDMPEGLPAGSYGLTFTVVA